MGAIHKKRFFLIIVLSFMCTAFLGFAMLDGAMATDISISSPTMKISASSIVNNKLLLYGALDASDGSSTNSKPLTYIRLVKPKLKNLCLVVHTGHIPVLGEYNLVIRSPLVTADYIVIRTPNLHSDISLNNFSLGIDAPHTDSSVPPGIFSLNAESGSLDGAIIDASYISASSLRLHNSEVSIVSGKYSC